MSCPHCSRSDPEHRFHFAMIRSAFDHWPHDHKFQPMNAEHLRGWLYVEAGHVNTVDLSDASDVTIKAVKAARQVLNPLTYLRMVETKTGLTLVGPRSISKGSCKKSEFRAVQDKVASIIGAVVGVSAEQLVKEKAA